MTNKSVADALPRSIFEEIEQIIEDEHKSYNTPFFSLHQGKTYFRPDLNLKRWQDGISTLEPHQHSPVKGMEELRSMIWSRFKIKNLEEISKDQVIITNGATHAIYTTLLSILQPGDEVLVLSPQWLFVNGLIKACRALPVEVPVYINLGINKKFKLTDILRDKLSSRTRAIYFNTPNNPTGVSLTKECLCQLVEFSKKNDLWLISDNAYDNYDFSQSKFSEIGEVNGSRERAFSIYTLSKTFAMPGLRIGYTIAPTRMVDALTKLNLYSVYAVSTLAQHAAVQVMKNYDSLSKDHRKKIAQARALLIENLEIPFIHPDGGFYAFLNLSKWNKGSTMDFIKGTIKKGVSLAPGKVFGKGCDHFARICYASVPPDKIEYVAGILNSHYHKGVE